MIDEQAKAVKEQQAELRLVADTLKATNAPLASAYETMEAQLKYIERNQTLLDTSLQKYELTLEEMTRKLGSGLGNIVDFQMQTSYASLNKALEDNVRRIINANAELIERLEDVLSQVLQQSRNETQAIMKVKEQMDIQFVDLKEDLKRDR